MKFSTMIVIALIAVIATVLIYLATGGHFVFFALPLLFGLPLMGRRRPNRDGAPHVRR